MHPPGVAGAQHRLGECPRGAIIVHPARSAHMLRGRIFRRRLPRLARPSAVLPSLYERHPEATTALRRPRGLQVVPIDRIVGTTRHPSQNTSDFLPLPGLRGRNWRARWLRIRNAVDALSILPAVELVKVGDEFYVADGHNRVAAALRAGAVAIDADVTELGDAGRRRVRRRYGRPSRCRHHAARCR